MSRHRKKKQQVRAHFNRRCVERLGELLPADDIIKRIQMQRLDDELQFYEKQSNNISRYLYRYKDKNLIIPYDKERHELITVLFEGESKFDQWLKPFNS